MNIFESLGLGLWEILFHTVNLLILIIALRFLLYKPVKRMIENHKTKLNEVFEQNQKLNSEASAMKQKYDTMLEEAKQEVMKVSAQAAHNAEMKSEETIEEAKLQAKNILENAKKEAIAEKQRLANDYRDSVSRLAVEIAEKVLEREINEKDNKKIIEECIAQWEDN